ncbi:MAG TPA: hypothetical protein VNA25_30685 [Phycisphaerae bacterium]|nr:hypothetical protein [Phycisphaerae bacterium]
MLKLEADQMIQEMADLFPRWDRTDGQVAGWVRILMAIPDTATARKAIMRLWGTSQRLGPTPSQFNTALEAVMPRSREPDGQGQKAGDKRGFTGVYIQCVEAPPQFPLRLGHFAPIIYALQDEVPDAEIVRHQATNLCRAYEGIYSGQWVVVQQADDDDMFEARRAMLAEAGLLAPPSKGAGIKGLTAKIGNQGLSQKKEIEANRRKLLDQARQLKGR